MQREHNKNNREKQVGGMMKQTQEIAFRIKNNRLIRTIVAPYINEKRKKTTDAYAKTSSAHQLVDLKDSYKGKRCFIIGNGPSLRINDLEALCDSITFAANRIYRLFEETAWRPDYYVAFEPEFVVANIDKLLKIPSKRGKFLNYRGYRGEYKDVYWINCTSKFCREKESVESILYSDDITQYVGDGYSVSYTILQIAMYMGFSDIYLVGMDHNKMDLRTTHYYEEKKTDYNTPTYWEGIEYAYSLAQKYAVNHGIRVFNATRGGQLEVFQRVNIDEILS